MTDQKPIIRGATLTLHAGAGKRTSGHQPRRRRCWRRVISRTRMRWAFPRMISVRLRPTSTPACFSTPPLWHTKAAQARVPAPERVAYRCAALDHPPLRPRPQSGGGNPWHPRSRAAYRVAARRTCAGSGRSARSAGKARRPFASQASRIQDRGSAPRQRTRSTCQRARPRPGAGRRSDSTGATRQRVEAAVGSRIRSLSATVHQRRSRRAVTPEDSAASCSRREAVRPSRVNSPTTAPRPFSCRPSSTRGRISRSWKVST